MRPAFLSVALLFALSFAQDPNGGTHSDHFDKQKYTLLDQLLITPKTHPNLFSFTGRWLRSPTAHPHSPAYHSTLWPGNSVTILVFGDKASVKLLPKPQGPVEHYSFAVSVDGGQDVRYNTDGFDTSKPKPEGYYIPLEFNLTKSGENAPTTKPYLEPHTIRITSISTTPFSFEGLLVPNTQVSQGYDWEEAQNHRPVVEFIGEGLDAERPGGYFRTDKYKPPVGETVESPQDAVFSTVHYKLGEYLGVRHTHMSTGSCFLPLCDSHQLPGLDSQYFMTSPVDSRGKSLTIKDKQDPRHLENLQTPWRFGSMNMRTNHPSHVVVDTGILDVVMKGADPNKYSHDLALFLARLRVQAHPLAKIMVIAHRGTPAQENTVVQADFTTTSNRQALYAATQRAVSVLGDPNTHFTPVILDSRDPQDSYLSAICPYMMPGVIARTKGFFTNQPDTKTHMVCAAVIARDGAWGTGAVGTILILMLAGCGLYLARSTILRAVASVVGRKRMGMPEEEMMLANVK
ncbi:hypothetical protein BZA77DRAFT_386162 [Pyronema omphalodes]|nr:hypothetical protein BZA77DRAFT_386162 [Pyronema omphalodes]